MGRTVRCELRGKRGMISSTRATGDCWLLVVGSMVSLGKRTVGKRGRRVSLTGGSRGMPVGPVLILGSTQLDLHETSDRL